MALDYLRKNPIDSLDFGADAEPHGTRCRRKFCKKKFSLLLSTNLIVWVIFAVSILDINVFSMNAITLPKIPQKLSVSGILYHETSPSALISNEVYRVGDVVEGYTIVRISRTEVEFQKDGKTLIRQTR